MLNYALFVFPVLIFFILFFILPFLTGIFYSLTSWDGIQTEKHFIGFENYRSLYKENGYLQILLFSLKFVFLNTAFTLVFGLFLALALEKSSRGNTLFRTLFFMPNIISPLVAGFVWTFMFNTILPFIGERLHLGMADFSFLGSPGPALGSLITVSFWQSIGYVMIIYIAGINNIDKSVMESVRMDGAGFFTQIRFITLPLIMPSVTINLFWLLSQSFRFFDLNVSLTNGGPGKTTTGLALDIYREGFGNNMMGLASAKAAVFFLLVFIITLIQLRITKSKEVSL